MASFFFFLWPPAQGSRGWDSRVFWTTAGAGALFRPGWIPEYGGNALVDTTEVAWSWHVDRKAISCYESAVHISICLLREVHLGFSFRSGGLSNLEVQEHYALVTDPSIQQDIICMQLNNAWDVHIYIDFFLF